MYEKELQVRILTFKEDVLTDPVSSQERFDGQSDSHAAHPSAKDKGVHRAKSNFWYIADHQTDLSLSLLSLDHLLRSQQLTFAFVGLAPSLLVLYGLGGWMRGLWRGEKRGKGRKRSYFNGLRCVFLSSAPLAELLTSIVRLNGSYLPLQRRRKSSRIEIGVYSLYPLLACEHGQPVWEAAGEKHSLEI